MAKAKLSRENRKKAVSGALTFQGKPKDGWGHLLGYGYAQFLPFQSQSFHQVVATFPTEYIFSQETLSEIYRVLRTDGKLILLPAAWITGGNLFDRLAAWLFKVTGQSPDIAQMDQVTQKIIRQFQNNGFISQAVFKEIRNSRALIIIAHKDSRSK